MVTCSGQVLDTENNPVKNTFVRVLPFDQLFEAEQNGNYEFQLEVDSTMDVTLRASADGYSEASTEVLALGGRTIDVRTLRLTQTAG